MNPNLTKIDIANKALIKIGARTITSLDTAVDTSSNAEIMAEIYDQCRLELLEEHPFSCAVLTHILVPLNPAAWVTDTSYIVGQFIQHSSAIYVCLVDHTSGTFATDLSNGDWQLQTGATPLLADPVDFNDGVQYAYQIPDGWLYPYLWSIPLAQYRIEELDTPQVATATTVILSDQIGLRVKYVFDNDDPATYTAKFVNCLACKLAYTACFKISEAAQYSSKVEAEYNAALYSAMAADSKYNTPDQPIANEWFIARLAGSGAVTGLPNGNIGFFGDPYNQGF